ncbi:radical SAM protein [Methanolapillus millepedarum]|uniref:Radical SAM core domain-containing protein n=1 Tax=Methanolapillus millepedarum TaxID=3028296 RepID=A0AA96ZTV6_9EURY|nr:hypothetical protein MsAc7_04480 [Methanosarcinaceae archaeon Ac7]
MSDFEFEDSNSGSFARFLSNGCVSCQKGAKMVLFVTGRCYRDCFYCPLSDERKDRDVVFANERPVYLDEDILEEAESMNAEGTGITGGEPLLESGSVLHYISLLKSRFGPGHHIHLYTSIPADNDMIQKLAAAGLDEIRFHPPTEMWESLVGSDFEASIRTAQAAGISAGIEIPALPNAVDVAVFAKKIDCFLNLNELEFSENNADAMKEHGFSLIDNESNAVFGSREIARQAYEVGGKINFCASRYKDAVQLRLRLIRTAVSSARPFDEITADGTIIYGKLKIQSVFLNDFATFLEDLEVPAEAYEILDPDGNSDDFAVVETAAGIAEELAEIFREDEISDFGEVQFWLFERYPFSNGFVVESSRIY